MSETAPTVEAENRPSKTQPEISEQDKQEYMKAFLKDAPFQKQFSLFDGALNVTFRTMTSVENTEVFKLINATAEGMPQSSVEGLYMTMCVHRMARMLVSVGANDTWFAVAEKPEDVTDLQHRINVINSWSTPKLNSLIPCLEDFDKLTMALTTKVLEKDFWKAAK